MGGLGPGIGGLEYLVIAAVALIVVGPERLPGMLRQMGKWVAKMRGMANEFRASFDEIARQSELDDLRKEVEALRQGQGAIGQGMVRLGDEANAAFRDIKSDLDQPALAAASTPVLNAPEFPEPMMTPLSEPAEATAPVAKVRKPRAVAPKSAAAEAKPRTPRKPKVAAAVPSRARTRAPRNAKLDL